MTHDDRPSKGALTGATGDLTPDDVDDAFVPAEQREISDPNHARDVTAATHRRATRRQAEPNLPGTMIGDDEIAPNARDGGYGSARGLAPDDPAYRMEERPETVTREPSVEERVRREPSVGGDVVIDPDKEHM